MSTDTARPSTKCWAHAGDTFALPARRTDAEPPVSPDWRLASFSIILPLPDGSLTAQSAEQQKKDFLNPTGLWIPGRYTGVRGFEYIPGAHASYAHHAHAKRRFRNGVNTSIASSVIDLNGTTDMDASAWDGRAVYHRVDFEPVQDFELADKCRECKRTDAPERAPRFEYTLPPDSARWSAGSVQLRCIELAQFNDRLNPERPVASSFLILHLVGQNLSSQELESISRALTRPRNKVLASGPHPSHDSAIDEKVPLRDIVREASRLLDEGGISAAFSMSQGGYLQRHNARQEAPKATTHSTWSRRSTRPMRVTCAIPWHTATTLPPPEEFSSDNDTSAWSVFDSWGWALSTGADRFYEAIPARTTSTRERQLLGEHEYWTLWGTSYGLSVVRKPGGFWVDEGTRSSFMKDPSLWMLASTRFVDLCLLTQRCALALHALESDMAISDTDLEEQLDRFNALQSQFLEFRNHLWFDVVSDHLLDSRVIKGLRKQSGQLSMYTDLRDEVEIRREIYDTRHAIRSVREQKLRAERAQKEQQDRDDRRDNQDKERNAAEQSRERLNVVIGIAAAILAVPAIAEATGITPSLTYFAVVLLIMIILSVGVFVGFRIGSHRRKKKAMQNSSRKNFEPPDTDS